MTFELLLSHFSVTLVAFEPLSGHFGVDLPESLSLRLLNALNSEDRGLKVRFALATIAFHRE